MTINPAKPTKKHTAVPVVVLQERKSSSKKKKSSCTLNTDELEKLLGQSDLIDKKVALISIAGAFRRGKSFMLNFFVNYLDFLTNGGEGEWLNEETVLDKFHWRGGSERDTNGIFLWSQPYILEDKNGEEIVVLLMDTQGTFDHKSTINDCVTIFALSTLVSSVQIFNVSQQIQEDDLNNLRLFTEMAQLARDENREQVAAFQKLLFLVRDWPNSDELNYGYEGGAGYLRKLLGSKHQEKELQKLREDLKNSFEKIEAFLMPNPGLGITRNNSEKVFGKAKPEPDFEEQLKLFVPSLFNSKTLKAKTVNGEKMTCGELMQLFKAYIPIFNEKKLPKVKTILETTAEVMNSVAEGKAKNEYDSRMKKKMSDAPNLSNLSTLTEFHSASVNEAMQVFKSRPKMNAGISGTTNESNLRVYFESRLGDFKRMVEQNIKVEAENKRLEAEKARLLEEQQRERQRIKAEEDRLAQVKAQQEEKLKKEREEMEKERRLEEERLRKQQLEQQREQERLRQEQQRVDAERRRAEQAREEAERQRQRAEEAMARRSYDTPSFTSYASPMSPSHDSASPSYHSPASNIRAEPHKTRVGNPAIRYRDMSSAFLPRSTSHASSPVFRPSHSSASSSHHSPVLNIRAETYTSSRGNQFTRYRDQWGRFAEGPSG